MSHNDYPAHWDYEPDCDDLCTCDRCCGLDSDPPEMHDHEGARPGAAAEWSGHEYTGQ
jgi:hypothetical protein